MFHGVIQKITIQNSFLRHGVLNYVQINLPDD